MTSRAPESDGPLEKRTSPALICSPSFLHHSAIVPAAMVCARIEGKDARRRRKRQGCRHRLTWSENVARGYARARARALSMACATEGPTKNCEMPQAQSARVAKEGKVSERVAGGRDEDMPGRA